MSQSQDIDTLSNADIWASMSYSELAHAHPNWDTWTPPATNTPTATKALTEKLGVGKEGFGNLEKCVVEPTEARGLAKALSESYTDLSNGDDDQTGLEYGFWLVPPLRAKQDTKLFSCTDRCGEAGTSIVIPEHKVGYPAKKGSIVTIKKGEFYGVGVINTKVFDQHVQKKLPCCSSPLVLLRSEKLSANKKLAFTASSERDLEQAIGNLSFPPVLPEKRLLGPGNFLALKAGVKTNSAGSNGSRLSVDKRSTLLASKRSGTLSQSSRSQKSD
ncbi:UNVERIFIED_CONTAM: hypothetical protein HDU68_000439 [Siphonaria sp. JEL0065]|nr:hypothetical protein HDU68_000439 [Siphonaria sp. JEL0065]